MKEITKEKLEKYFSLTSKALEKAKIAPENLDISTARETFLDTVTRYISDAKHFQEKGEFITAFAAINYAHGWLDAGARIGLWEVYDSELFAVENKK